LIRELKKPFQREVIGADGIDPDGAHAGEVEDHRLRRGELLSAGVRGERSIRHTMNAQAPPAACEEFPVDPHSPDGPGNRFRKRSGIP